MSERDVQVPMYPASFKSETSATRVIDNTHKPRRQPVRKNRVPGLSTSSENRTRTGSRAIDLDDTYFEIHEEEKLKLCLVELLLMVQQIACKMIAKDWIKAIYPRKQGRYPYVNQKRMKDDGLDPEVPPWWPPLRVCPFREPDHLSKNREFADTILVRQY